MMKKIILIISIFILCANLYPSTQIGYKDFKLGMNRKQILALIKKTKENFFIHEYGKKYDKEKLQYLIWFQIYEPSSFSHFEFDKDDYLYRIEITNAIFDSQKSKILSILKSKYGEPEIRSDDGIKISTYKVRSEIFVDFIEYKAVYPKLIYYNKKIMDNIQRQIEERKRQRERINRDEY